ncbi:NAD-P-binding protein [Mycena metata]|uniref:NAD-P-binding protein n=1 Tax=Mycena metata TaxID=1033252 RepID=A0AAD7KKS7_9AGAR|nr:NAD-P-binding protein [Mycena metata]
MRILVFGSTGPTGLLLVRETLAVQGEGTVLILYVRSPEKLPEDIKRDSSCIVIQGQLDDESSLSQAMEGVDLVLSALGPAQFTHPSVDRLIALGTVSIEDESDRFNLAYYTMVKSVSVSMRNAYKDIRAIGAVIRASGLEHWTIPRVPVLSNNPSRDVIAGYIGDGKTKNHVVLNRIGFAAFVVGEITQKQWDKKAPLLVSP